MVKSWRGSSALARVSIPHNARNLPGRRNITKEDMAGNNDCTMMAGYIIYETYSLLAQKSISLAGSAASISSCWHEHLKLIRGEGLQTYIHLSSATRAHPRFPISELTEMKCQLI